jgi:hypothetical protein
VSVENCGLDFRIDDGQGWAALRLSSDVMAHLHDNPVILRDHSV